jgi:hypothetical protein
VLSPRPMPTRPCCRCRRRFRSACRPACWASVRTWRPAWPTCRPSTPRSAWRGRVLSGAVPDRQLRLCLGKPAQPGPGQRAPVLVRAAGPVAADLRRRPQPRQPEAGPGPLRRSRRQPRTRLLTALREVEDALSDVQQRQLQGDVQAQAQQAAAARAAGGAGALRPRRVDLPRRDRRPAQHAGGGPRRGADPYAAPAGRQVLGGACAGRGVSHSLPKENGAVMRSRPRGTLRIASAPLSAAAICARMARQLSTYWRPISVRLWRRVVRVSSRAPRVASSWAMCLPTMTGEMSKLAAAAVKLPVSTTATKISMLRSLSMIANQWLVMLFILAHLFL